MNPLLPMSTPAEDSRVIYELDNGMKVVIKEDHFSPVAAMQVWVDVGGADETDVDAGIAHVHEHMLFKGTANRGVGEIARSVEGAGGRINAWTSWDHTVYHLVVASRFADQGLDVLADAVQYSSFDPVELRKELGVVMEEYKRGLDMPSSRLFHTLFGTAFTVHPYRRPVIGTEQSILDITREKVLEFYARYYSPQNMTLVIVGDVDTEHMKALVSEKFAGFHARPVGPMERLPEPEQDETRFAEVTMDVKESHLALGFHVPDATHPDTPALDLLAHVLGSGASSRLYDRLVVESQLATDVGAFAYTPEDPGMFIVTASLEAGDTEALLEAAIDELARVRSLPVSRAELDRARANLEADFIYRRQTVQGQARELGQLVTVYGDPDYDRKYIAALGEATPAKLQKIAERYLSADNLTVVSLTPTGDSGQLTSEGVRTAAAPLAAEGSGVVWAEADRVPEGTGAGHAERMALRRPDTKPRMVRLANGARIIVQEHHDVPVFSVRVGMLGGLLAETPENNGISGFAATMLTRGTRTRSRQAFARAVESLAGDINGFSGRNSLGLSAGFLSWHFAEGMDLFLNALLEPAFDPEEVEKARRELSLAIKNRADETATVAFDLLYATMYPGHPYGMRTVGETETIAAITRDDLEQFFVEARNPKRLVFSVVGDVDADEVVRVIKSRFGDKLHFADDDFVVPPAPVPVDVRREHVAIERAQSHIVLGFPGVGIRSPDRYAVSVLETILSGQGGRLFYRLRDVEGLAYSVMAFSSQGLADGILGAYIATDPANTDKAIASLLAELERVAAHPAAPDEIGQAKRYLIGTHAIALQTNGAIADEMLFNELYGLGFHDGKRYEARIDAVTAADVQDVARRYLRPEVRAVATVGPAADPAASQRAAATRSGKSE